MSQAAPPLNRHAVDALDELSTLSPLYQRGSFELLHKILGAVQTTPGEAKFRRLNTAKLRPKLRATAALKLLESLGFVPQMQGEGAQAEEWMVMTTEPTPDQLQAMQTVRDRLQEILTAAASSSKPASAASSSAASSSASVSPAVSSEPCYPSEGDTVEDSTHVLFWKPPSWGGQWTQCATVIDGVRYLCAEQYMMAQKAKLFGDHTSFAKIMTTASPREHKKLGRGVKNFDASVWDAKCLDIVVAGNYAKFSQHPAYRARLLATGSKTIVEASPLDSIWGVGMAASDPDIRCKAKWRGKNLLGEALMRVRARLQQEDEQTKQQVNGWAAAKAADAAAK